MITHGVSMTIDEDPGAFDSSITSAPSLGAWLATHGVADCEQTLRGEGVDNLEDLMELVTEKSDFEHLGIAAQHAERLWRAMQGASSCRGFLFCSSSP